MVHRDTDDTLTELIAAIEGVHRLESILTTRWVGRRVRLLKDVETPTMVLLKAGTVGVIKEVRLDPHAPFAIQFDGRQYKFAPLLEKLEVLTS